MKNKLNFQIEKVENNQKFLQEQLQKLKGKQEKEKTYCEKCKHVFFKLDNEIIKLTSVCLKKQNELCSDVNKNNNCNMYEEQTKKEIQ